MDDSTRANDAFLPFPGEEEKSEESLQNRRGRPHTPEEVKRPEEHHVRKVVTDKIRIPRSKVKQVQALLNRLVDLPKSGYCLSA